MATIVRWHWQALCICALYGCAQTEPADMILLDAAIYTLDPARPWVEALAVRGGKILALGTDAEIAARFDGPARRLDGAMVLPGFHDAHVHPIGAGIDLGRCDLGSAESVESIVALLRECDARDPGDGWLLGYGWSLALFPNANPHRSVLDAVAARRPILLQGADGHSSWANSAAFELAAIGSATAAPPLGVIERDADGTPSGTVRETAQELLWALVPESNADERRAALRRGIATLNRYGVTSLIEANATAQDLQTYRELATRDELDARVVVSIADAAFDAIAAEAPEVRAASGARVRAGAVKIFLDGVLEGETAALLEPYLTDAGDRLGQLNVSPAALAARVTSLDAAGIQVHVHAIGDRAVRTALDAFEAARRANGRGDARHHIAHLQLVDPADYPRFAELEVTANFQAVWAFPDDYIVGINLPQVGPERVQRMYPIGSLARAGARIVAGSDWNVTTPNPLVAIEVALTRRDPSGRRSAVLNGDEAVDLETMLRAYTRNGAWLMHQEQQVGVLAPGMLADLVVLGSNLFEIPVDAIGEVPVLATYLDGRLVYDGAARP